MTTNDPNNRSTMGTPGSIKPTESMDRPGVVSQAASQVKDTTGQAVDKAKEVTAPVVDKAKEATAPVVEQARQTATTQIAERKDQAAQSVGAVAETLRQTGQQLRGGEGQAFASLAIAAADRMDNLSGYLRDRDVNDLVADVEDFARRQPILFLSGAFALGALAARFLKSSSAYNARDYDFDRYDRRLDPNYESPYRRTYQGYTRDYPGARRGY